jgi:hypothetical protein
VQTTVKLFILSTLAYVSTVGLTQNGVAIPTAPLPTATGNSLLLVLAAPKPGMDQAFESWYANHLVEFTRIPGVLAARRNRLLPLAAIGITLPPSLAMYELDGARLDQIDAEVASRLKDGRISRGEAVDYAGIITIKARPLGPALFARDVPGAAPEPLGSEGPVKEYQFIVFSDPTTSDVEKQYNDWYDHQHMPDVLRVPGFVFAQRFIVTSASANSQTARYFILFNLLSRDLSATNAEIRRRLREKITVPTTTMSNGTASFMEPVGPAVLASGG